MDRGAWWATVHWVAKSQTITIDPSIHPPTHPIHPSIWVPNRKMHKGDKRQLTKEIEMTKNLENLNVSRTQEMCIKTLRTASEHGQ